MPRPKIPIEDLHERSFRVRLKDEDANLIIALARKLDEPPAVLLRRLIRQQIAARGHAVCAERCLDDSRLPIR